MQRRTFTAPNQLLIFLPLILLSCNYVNSLVSSPTPTPTPVPLDLVMTFNPNPIDAVPGENGTWVWNYTFTVNNPNGFPVKVVAFGADDDDCSTSTDNCHYGALEFSQWFTQCDPPGESIQAGGTACDSGYYYQMDTLPASSTVIHNVIWYRDPSGNLLKTIGPALTLNRPELVVNVVNTTSLYDGPGYDYHASTTLGINTTLKVYGQAFDCAWFQVLDSSGLQGWVPTSDLSYPFGCNGIPAAAYPTMTPTPIPTEIPPTPTLSCSLTGSIYFNNTTGETVTIYLNGPASFTFYLPIGDSAFAVCPGYYNYTAYGCGGATDTGTISSGSTQKFYCN